MKLSRSIAGIGIAAGMLGGMTGLAVAASRGPSASAVPSTIKLVRSDNTPNDVRGPCDEAEHANDPRCTGPSSTASSPGTTVAEDGTAVRHEDAPAPAAGAVGATPPSDDVEQDDDAAEVHDNAATHDVNDDHGGAVSDDQADDHSGRDSGRGSDDSSPSDTSGRRGSDDGPSHT
jgi:hypothetical protein